MEKGLLVIGQGPAGVQAAKSFRELDQTTPVTLLAEESYDYYARPRLPEVVSGKRSADQISIHNKQWFRDHNITVEHGKIAVDLDCNNKTVKTEDNDSYYFDKLVLAPGATPDFPPIKGLPCENVIALRSMVDAITLNQIAQGKHNAILIGGGLLGLEAGYALTQLGVKVIVIELAPRLLPRQLDEESAALLQEQLMPMGFEFFLGAKVEKLAFEQEHIQLTLESDLLVTGDLAVLSAGIAPRIGLAKKAGLECNRGIVVNDFMQTSCADVWAVGDAAEWQGKITGLWNAALATGKIAGKHIAGNGEPYTGIVASTKLKVAGIEVWSQGNIQVDGAEIVTRRNDEKGELVKLFIRGKYLVGSIQIGNTKNSVHYKKIIENKISVETYKQDIIHEDFDFKQI